MGQVHRFRDAASIWSGTGETVYMPSATARALGTALIAIADSIDREAFSESAGLTHEFQTGAYESDWTTAADEARQAVEKPSNLLLPADYDPLRDGRAVGTFDDEPSFPCFPHGSTWNGWDNVSVSPQVRDMIVEHWRGFGPNADEESLDDFAALGVEDDGKVSLSNCYTVELYEGITVADCTPNTEATCPGGRHTDTGRGVCAHCGTAL